MGIVAHFSKTWLVVVVVVNVSIVSIVIVVDVVVVAAVVVVVVVAGEQKNLCCQFRLVLCCVRNAVRSVWISCSRARHHWISVFFSGENYEDFLECFSFPPNSELPSSVQEKTNFAAIASHVYWMSGGRKNSPDFAVGKTAFRIHSIRKIEIQFGKIRYAE